VETALSLEKGRIKAKAAHFMLNLQRSILNSF